MRFYLSLVLERGEDFSGSKTRKASHSGPWPGGLDVILQGIPLSECHFPGFKIKVLETGGVLRTRLITSLIFELQLWLCSVRNNALPFH